MDLLLYDLRMQVLDKPVLKQEPPIVIIDIDEKSLQQIGRWPWPRQQVAHLINAMLDAGAIIVGLDIVFAEAEANLIDRLINATNFSAELDQQLIAEHPRFDGDRLLGEKISAMETVSGFILHHNSELKIGLLPEGDESQSAAHLAQLSNMQGYTANLEKIQENALSSGFLSIFPDRDGIVRRAPLILRHEDRVFNSLSLEMAQQFLFDEPARLAWADTPQGPVLEGLEFNKRFIATDPRGQVLIPFMGKRKHFPYYSASSLLAGELSDEALDGALVLVGTSALGLADLKTTPIDSAYPGVEIHASLLEALLHHPLPAAPDWELGGSLFLIFVFGLLLSILLPQLSASVMTLLWLISLGAIFYANAWLWTEHHLSFSLAPLLVVVVGIGFLNMGAGFFRESSQRHSIQAMFGQYVAPAHIKRLINSADPGQSFGGETKELTVLFADIRSFTQISESLSASELKSLLNRFFTPMTEIIFKQQGTIDKYVGDMIMAFWGAPIDDAEQAQHGVLSAMAMQERLVLLNSELAAEGLPRISIGIGLNTGAMNVGDMGSHYRRAYTVLGDAVNLGSRLESISKFYKSKIIVSEETMRQSQGIIYRNIDYIQVVGKEEAIRIYEPLYLAKEQSPEQLELESLYQQARQSYLDKNWGEAEAGLQQFASLGQDREVHLAQLYLERIKQLQGDCPEPWQGVYQHLSK